METLKIHNESLADCLSESFLFRKDKSAITFLRHGRIETDISFLELEKSANRVANTFLALGVKKGDRVILFIEKSLMFVVAHLALQKLGAISVPLNPGFKNPKWIICLKTRKRN